MQALSEMTKSKLAGYKFTVPQGGSKVFKYECIYCFDDQVFKLNFFLNIENLKRIFKDDPACTLRQFGISHGVGQRQCVFSLVKLHCLFSVHFSRELRV